MFHFGLSRPEVDSSILIKTVDTSNGALSPIVVDHQCAQYDRYELCAHGSDYYHAPLIKVNCDDNKNKYIIMELLKVKNEIRFIVYTRCGRIGFTNSQQYYLFSEIEEGKSFFEKTFYEKTGNRWSNRDNFLKITSKYEFVQVFYTTKIREPFSSVENRLDSSIKNFLTYTYDCENCTAALKKMNRDLDIIKLGVMPFTQIQKGFALLMKISILIEEKKEERRLVETVNDYYMNIPQNFGRKQPPMIMSLQQVKEQLVLLWQLSKFSIAVEVFHLNSTNTSFRKEMKKQDWRLRSINYSFALHIERLNSSRLFQKEKNYFLRNK